MRWRLDADPVAIEPFTVRQAGSARLRSDSTGTVRLRSADAAAPRFEPSGLGDPLEIERLAQADRRHRGLEVAHRPQIGRLCAHRPHPGTRRRRAAGLILADGFSFPPRRRDLGDGTTARRRRGGRCAGTCVHGRDRLSVVDASIVPNRAPRSLPHQSGRSRERGSAALDGDGASGPEPCPGLRRWPVAGSAS
jgi:hypothetical protein